MTKAPEVIAAGRHSHQMVRLVCNACFGEASKPWMPPCWKCSGAGIYFAILQSQEPQP